MNKYKVIAISGESASGKDTLLRRIVQLHPELHQIINCTTRPPRAGEVDGVNYYFMTLDELYNKHKNGELLEVTEFRGWGYGTTVDGVRTDCVNIGVFNPSALYSLMISGKVSLFVVKVNASGKIRLLRSLEREENPDVDEIVRRYLADKKDFEDFSTFYEPDYIVDNNEQGWDPARLHAVAHDIVQQACSLWAEEAN